MTTFPSPFGRFADDGDAFHISTPDTPTPWVNVICNGRYGLTVSQNGGGFSWLDDAQHCVLTRWEMDLVRDPWGKFIYASDLDSGKLWSLAPAPCRPRYTGYECVHGVGFTRFLTEFDGVRARWELAVAPRDNAEIWLVRLENTTDRPRRLRVSSYFEWSCGVAPDVKREFHKIFLETRHDEARHAIIADKHLWDVPPKHEKQHWNQSWPYTAAHACHGALTNRFAIADKAAFLGRYGQFHSPTAMTASDPPRSTGFGRFSDPVAALGGELTLAPGASADLHWILAIAPHASAPNAGMPLEETPRPRSAAPAAAPPAPNLAAFHPPPPRIEDLLDRYTPRQAAEAAPASARQMWRSTLAPTSVTTQRRDFDLLVNTWLPYQALSARLWGRTGYYQQSGAFGFRDQLQDSQVWLTLDPAGTRRQILLHATRQFTDGSVNHWWHPLADFGNHTACSDDYLWLPFITAQYLKETGDYPILDERSRTMDAPALVPLIEKCKRTIARAFERTSPRGIPLIGSCDWNDGLSAMGIDGKGESVWLGWFLCHILEDWALILERRGDAKTAREYRDAKARYAHAINQHAWDDASGWNNVHQSHVHQSLSRQREASSSSSIPPSSSGYFKYGTKDDGSWIGASDCPAGRIHLNAQTWAVLGELSNPERLASCWNAVKERLLQPFGPLLLAPAYATPDESIGYITRYAPGLRENGGVYMHAATWALAAACKRRDLDAVARIWASISPPVRGHDAEGYRAEPYVLPGNVDGPDSATPGRAGWTWYTGSAAWLRKVALDWVIGVRAVFTPRGEGLLIDPVPPKDLGQVECTRAWRGCTLRVRFNASSFDPTKPPRLSVDGRAFDGNTLPVESARGAVEVDVTW
jgi:cellobiose phosphorylase